ncbi:AraC family transcriptional regulator [Thauera sinica]|uniref:AraC family transcriptional regulator n=1 Tax=Thauera sinica TaxID=2665146 RepID=A0ABW1ARG4_9RHOO|nr:AraC family transcriptional regulator [Thauera sp. K11]ATE62568.1 AraC family transcriptional regulator [Thauera sp. K11]
MLLDEPALPGHGRVRDAALVASSNLLFQLDDTDSVRERVGQVFKPHDLAPLRTGERVNAFMHHVRRGRLSLSRLEYGTGVKIDPGRLDSFYLVQIPVRGSAFIHCGGHRFESRPGLASLVSPGLPLSMRWEGGAPQIVLRIDRDQMLFHCRQHLGGECERPPEFCPELDLTRSGGAYFAQLLGLLMDAVAQPDHPLHQPLVLKQFESSLINALLYGVPSTVSELLAGGTGKAASPYYVKRAEEYIRAHLNEPLSIELLAEHAGASVRTLFAGFRNACGTSPMSFLRNLRLDQVRAELAGGERVSVSEIAYKWGFNHLGRFAREYKRRFGESPSATLRHRPD